MAWHQNWSLPVFKQWKLGQALQMEQWVGYPRSQKSLWHKRLQPLLLLLTYLFLLLFIVLDPNFLFPIVVWSHPLLQLVLRLAVIPCCSSCSAWHRPSCSAWPLVLRLTLPLLWTNCCSPAPHSMPASKVMWCSGYAPLHAALVMICNVWCSVSAPPLTVLVMICNVWCSGSTPLAALVMCDALVMICYGISLCAACWMSLCDVFSHAIELLRILCYRTAQVSVFSHAIHALLCF
jgi:hypothetical protein